MAEELKIQITLDDGSIKQGFLNIEKHAKNTGKKIESSFGDKGSGFGKLADGAKEAAQAISGGPSSIALRAASALGPVGAVVIAVGSLAAAFTKVAIDGEKANSINLQFKNVTQAAGIESERLADSLRSVADGLIDDTDLLELATKSTIALGTEASKLPQILNLARSVSKTLGTDFKQTFGDLSTFLETGNAKILRQFGIVLDLDKAYAAAAKSIGVATADLTKQQEQMVRIGLLVDGLPGKFQKTAESITPIQDAITRLTVSAKQKFEDISIAMAETFAVAFIDNADKSNVATARLSGQLEKLRSEADSLSSRLKILNEERLGAKGASALTAYSLNITDATKKFKAARDEIALLNVEISSRGDAALFAALESTRKPVDSVALQLTDEQKNKLFKDAKLRESDLTKFLQAEEIIRRQADLENVNAKESRMAQIASLELRQRQDLEVLEIQHKQKMADIDKQFSADKFFTSGQIESAITALTASNEAQKLKIIEDANLKIRETSSNTALNTIANLNSISDAISYIGANAKTHLAGAFVSGMQAATNAIVAGQNGMDALVKSVLGAIGDIAVQFGALFLLQAAGFAVIPGLQGNSATLATAGAGLIGLGLLLKVASASINKSAGPDTGGGGIASSPSSSTELTPSESLTRQQAGTSVSLTVQGNILDSDESGSRIVALINSAFDKKGVVINQGVMA